MNGKAVITEKRPRFGLLPEVVERELSPYLSRMRTALHQFRDETKARYDAMRSDGWANPITGFGTERDKTTYGYILPTRFLTDEELSALYHSDDMAARMVDVIPQEMLREEFTVETGTPDLDTAVADKVKSLGMCEKLADGIRWGRCYGGAALMIGADDGRDANTPLRPELARDLSYLYVIDRRYLWPITYYDEPGHPKLGQPKTYMVTSLGGTVYHTAEVHESRLVLFYGSPTGTRERQLNSGWTLSVLQRPYDILRQFNTGWTAVETMLVDGNQAIYKMGGLAEMIAAGGQDLLKERIRAMDMFRSVVRALVIDADGKEELTRQSVSFSEIPATLEKFMLRLAAAVQMPVTILMGQSPAGMNATGESDFRWFYDRIRAEQNTTLSPKIRSLVATWLLTKRGQEIIRRTAKQSPQSLTVKFPPLWTETPAAEAERNFKIAQTDEVYLRNQVLTPEEVALARFRPEGFKNDVQLTEESRAAREAIIKMDLEAGTVPIEEVSEEVKKTLELTASDLATITKVNEARASVGLKPLPKPDGELTLPEFKAKYAATIAKGAAAEGGEDPNAPKPSFGGFGAKPPPPPPKQDEENKEPNPELEEEERQDAKLRTFELHRDVDETGVSGTGVVAEGCIFADGRVALRWKTATASTTLFDNIEQALKVHGHAGKTRVVYTDE